MKKKAQRNLSRYKFHDFNPAFAVEIFLPKNAEYQGALYEALTSGFKKKVVRKHFKNKKLRASILGFLEYYYTDLLQIGSEEFEKMISLGVIGQTNYVGYSMYEVDGVFWSEKRQSIDEERTQVIKLIFQPDLSSLKKQVGSDFPPINSFVATYLSKPPGERKLMVKDMSKVDEQFIAQKIDEWRRSIAIFLFGFLVYKICEKLEHLSDERSKIKAKKASKATPYPLPEDELWVAAIWNLAIYSIRPKD